ncbi:NUDIX domain-containing protein [archaeon]|nr:NUDIX domain-containing protein [archaeon]
MKQILVTAAITEYKGKYLIAQRLPICKNAPLKWEFPGGKVKFGEDARDCLKREIKEELGIEIKVGEIFETTSHILKKQDEDIHIVLLFFKCKLMAGTPKKLQVNNYAWVKKEEFNNFQFINESDLKVIRKIINK